MHHNNCFGIYVPVYTYSYVHMYIWMKFELLLFLMYLKKKISLASKLDLFKNYFLKKFLLTSVLNAIENSVTFFDFLENQIGWVPSCYFIGAAAQIVI